MPRIRIVLDQHGLGSAPTDAFKVSSEAEYFESRRHIREALGSDTETVLWVTGEALACRYDDLLSSSNVTVERYSPRRELERLLEASLPPELTDQMVADCRLAQLARRKGRFAQESVHAWCLRVLAADDLQSAITPDDIPRVLSCLLSIQQEHANAEPLVSGALRQWQASASVGRLHEWLSRRPFRNLRLLICTWASRGYAERQLQWLTQEGYGVAEVQEAQEFAALIPEDCLLPEQGLPHGLRSILVAELTNGLRSDFGGPLAAAVAHTRAEQEAVLRHLTQRADQGHGLSQSDAQAVTRWVERSPQGELRSKTVLAAELLTERELPEPLDPAADLHYVRYWLAKRYIPAYYSRAVTGRLGETQSAVESFESWLVNNYQTAVVGAGVHTFAADLAEKLRDAAVWLVLLDGVPYGLVERLHALLAAEAGPPPPDCCCYFSLLPSTTRVNQPAMIYARLADQAGETNGNRIAEAWRVPADRVKFDEINLDNAMQTWPTARGHLSVLRYRYVDERLLHEPATPLERWTSAWVAIEKLAASLRGAIQNARHDNVSLWLGCVSDHGWTELPAEADVRQLPDELAKLEDHRRVLWRVGDEQYGHVLQADMHYLTENCTIARAYTCFQRRAQGAVHGGATPQEVTCGGFWLTTRAARQIYEPPALRLEIVGDVMRRRQQNPVSLRLHNPTETEARVSAIWLGGIAVAEGFPLAVEPHGWAELPANVDASAVDEPMLSVEVTVRWAQHSSSYDQRLNLQVPTRGAATRSKEFEDMFDR